MSLNKLNLFITSTLVLAFLAACSSDDQPSNSVADDFKVQVSFVGHAGQPLSSKTASEKKPAKMKSQVRIHVSDLAQVKHFEFATKCYGKVKEFKKTTLFKKPNTGDVKIVDILPMELFSPASELKEHVECVFNLQVKNVIGSTRTLEAVLLYVTGMDNYSNFDPLRLVHGPMEIPDVFIEDIETKPLEDNFKRGESFLLCDYKEKFNPVQPLVGQKITFSQFDYKENLVHKPIQKCRIVSVNKSGRQKVSSYFMLHKQYKNVEVHFVPHKVIVPVSHPFSLVLKNPNHQPVFVALKKNETAVLTLRPAFTQFDNWHVRGLGLEGMAPFTWVYDQQYGPAKYVVVDKKNPNLLTIRIPGKQYVKINGILNDSRCNIHPNGGVISAQYGERCRLQRGPYSTYFRGVYGRITDVPYLAQSEYQDINKLKWRPLRDHFKKSFDVTSKGHQGRYSFFLPADNQDCSRPFDDNPQSDENTWGGDTHAYTSYYCTQ